MIGLTFILLVDAAILGLFAYSAWMWDHKQSGEWVAITLATLLCVAHVYMLIVHRAYLFPAVF